MRNVKVQYAKTHLSAILADVEAGEVVTISRGAHEVARLVPVRRQGERDLGFVAYDIPESFWEELPAEELRHWEGS